MLFTFDRKLQAGQGVIPLVGNVLQAAARGFQLPRFNFPQALAADADVAHQAGAGEDVQMFGDGLAGDFRTVGEARNGQRAHGAQAHHEIEPGFIAERGKHRGGSAYGIEGGAGAAAMGGIEGSTAAVGGTGRATSAASMSGTGGVVAFRDSG